MWAVFRCESETKWGLENGKLNVANEWTIMQEIMFADTSGFFTQTGVIT